MGARAAGEGGSSSGAAGEDDDDDDDDDDDGNDEEVLSNSMRARAALSLDKLTELLGDGVLGCASGTTAATWLGSCLGERGLFWHLERTDRRHGGREGAPPTALSLPSRAHGAQNAASS